MSPSCLFQTDIIFNKEKTLKLIIYFIKTANKAFHSLALVIVQGLNKAGTVKLEASIVGPKGSTTEIKVE